MIGRLKQQTLSGINEYDAIQFELTLELMKRILGVKVRDVGLHWPYEEHPVDVRFEPLLKSHQDPADITGLKKVFLKHSLIKLSYDFK